MKIVITGSLGNVSKPLAQKLVKSGHQVVVISSKADKVKTIEELGAKAAIGSVEDVQFLTAQFTGADAVYAMVPPTMSTADWKGYIENIGQNLAQAIQASGVKNVVLLSSVGAHLEDGCGPVSGLYRVEQIFNKLKDVNLVYLRAGFFYNNLFSNLNLIINAGIIGSNYQSDKQMILVDPADIASAAYEKLNTLSFKGHSVEYVVSDLRTNAEVAKALGAAIGKNDLPWVEFKDEDSLGGMLGAGLPQEIAKNYVEMGTAVRSGKMFTDFELQGKPVSGKTKLEDFAKVFAAVYNN